MTTLHPSPLESAWQYVNSGRPLNAETLYGFLVGARREMIDVRSGVLFRDILVGLASFWGESELQRRLADDGASELVRYRDWEPEETGFSTLEQRLMTPTDPQTVIQMFRELGARILTPASIIVGGSLALMLNQLLSRHTDDVDIVDELPTALREDHSLLEELATRYGLRLTHFQSHYLPDDWKTRTRSLGIFDRLDVRLIDPIDIIVGKLFSKRAKDLDDVRHVMSSLDRSIFKNRVSTCTTSFRNDASLSATAKQNWFILTGESDLPRL